MVSCDDLVCTIPVNMETGIRDGILVPRRWDFKPVVVFTMTDDAKVREEMVKLGVADYIIKGTVPLQEVVERIMGAIERPAAHSGA